MEPLVRARTLRTDPLGNINPFTSTRQDLRDIPNAAGLTPTEAAIVNYIATRGNVHREQIMDLLYSDAVNPPEYKIIDVYISKARKKLRPHEVDILTLHSRGYGMTEENAARWRALVRSAAPSVEALTDEIHRAFLATDYETIGLNELAEATAIHLRERGIA